MGIFNDGWEDEVYRLKAEIAQLKNDLRIANEGRQFFYKDAKAEHMRAERLQAELNHLRAQLATHTNPEDTYRDDFGGNIEDRYWGTRNDWEFNP